MRNDETTPDIATINTKATAAIPSALRPGARLGVVLVNWKRHDFTIECLESLLRSDIPLQVVVVDNASGDGSVGKIAAWASGAEPYAPPGGEMGRLSTPPLEKSIPLDMLDAVQAIGARPAAGHVTLIEAGDNLGFAGGNNLGIRHLLNDERIEAVWLLNNDTVVEPDAAGQIWQTFRTSYRIGMCGTVVRFYHRPEAVQVLNGYRFSLLTGQGKPICGGKTDVSHMSPHMVTAETDFVLGASLAVSRAFLEEIGLMSEAYFLYYEEIDWATRNHNRKEEPFHIGYARGATVYHKEGGSIGSGGGKGKRSAQSDYYMLRARLIFYRRHYPVLLPLQWLQGVMLVGRRLLRRQPKKALMLLKALAGMRPTGL